MSTQVHLNPTMLSILSISRDKYWIFISSILQLLYHSVDNSNFQKSSIGNEDDDDDDGNGLDEYSSNTSASDGDGLNTKLVDNSSKLPPSPPLEEPIEEDTETEDYFFHIALTPVECTIICSQKLMKQYFQQPIEICKQLNYHDVQLLPEKYLCLSVDCDGSSDNSLRILELTKPLSENNISLFFISSHFNDIVLIPYDLKQKVINILTKNSFEFLDVSNSYIPTFGASPIATEFDFEQGSKKLEERTFESFKQSQIHPMINNKVKLLLTGSRQGEVNNAIIKSARILSSTETIPNYFAITRTYYNEVSLVLPKSSKQRIRLGFDSKYIIGSTQDIIIPITIDFSKLPLDSTGIVAGLASKLITAGENVSELYYFSMARSGVVMIPQENIDTIAKILHDV